MTPRPDIALCPVKAKSCTHHAHCLRAQLPPHPTRQAWFTPNGRGDECRYFLPTEAFTHAGSDAADTEPRTNVEAGGFSFEVGRATVSANTTSTGHAAGSSHVPTSILSGVTHDAGFGVKTGDNAGAGLGSAPVRPSLASLARHAAGLGSRAYAVAAQRITRGQQLRAARLIFGRRSPA